MEKHERHENLVNREKQKKQYKKRIAELFEIGLNADDVYAWHGTSIEAIQRLAENGKFPTTGQWGKEFYYCPKGGFYFDERDDGQQLAKRYAGVLAMVNYVLSRLPFQVKDLKNFTSIFYFKEYLAKFIAEEAVPNGVNEQFVQSLIQAALEIRKKGGGVLISISRRLAQDFPEEKGGSLEDKKVTTPDGLPLEYITGIVPLGEYEKEVLKKIQKEVL